MLDTLERHGLAPARLKLELTERVLAGDIRRVRAVMEALAARGVEFYLTISAPDIPISPAWCLLPLQA